MRALALVLAVTAYPALAEPYRPLPRYTPEKVRQRVSVSRAAQRVHSQAPVPVAPTDPAPPAVAEEPVHVIAIPPQPEPSPAAPAAIATAAAPPPPAKLADLKVTVGQAGADGGFVMLVEDPSGGARIELTLDGGGRLLSVRRAGAL